MTAVITAAWTHLQTGQLNQRIYRFHIDFPTFLNLLSSSTETGEVEIWEEEGGRVGGVVQHLRQDEQNKQNERSAFPDMTASNAPQTLRVCQQRPRGYLKKKYIAA